MTFWNRRESNIPDALQESPGDGFTFVALKEEILEQYGLPKQPCPVRASILESLLSKGSLPFSLLADECILYYNQHSEGQSDIKPLLLRLCYMAGINAGQGGDDLTAQKYLSVAYNADPNDLQIASNYALALSKIGQSDDSLEVYEKILAFLQNGKLGFSPQVWTAAVKIHHMKGNYERALELVEIAIQEAPQYFGEDAKVFAQELIKKIENG